MSVQVLIHKISDIYASLCFQTQYPNFISFLEQFKLNSKIRANLFYLKRVIHIFEKKQQCQLNSFLKLKIKKVVKCFHIHSVKSALFKQEIEFFTLVFNNFMFAT
jgi:hypothetical protein